MPVKSSKTRIRPLIEGDYYVHRRSRRMVEIMAVDPPLTCSVLDVTAPLDGAWEQVPFSQLGSCLWERVDPVEQAG